MAVTINGSVLTASDVTDAATSTLTYTSAVLSAGDVLLAVCAQNGSANPPSPAAPTGGTGLTWVQVADQQNTSGHESRVTAYWAAVGSGQTSTLTQVTTRTTSGDVGSAGALYRLSGADTTTPVGASNGFQGQTDPTGTSLQITGTAAGSMIFVIGSDWSAGTASLTISLTGVSSTTTDLNNLESGQFRGISAHGAQSSSTNQATLDYSGATGDWAAAIFEIKAAAGAAADIPYATRPQPRSVDTVEGPWLQRDRRDATAVASDAPSAPSGPAAGRGPARDPGGAWWQQARRQSDPALLATALIEVPSTARQPLTARDTGEGYWGQLVRRADQSTGPASFDPLSAGERAARLAPVTHADRREVPAQRAYPAPPDTVEPIGTGALGAWWSDDPTVAYMAARVRQSDPSLLVPPAGTPFDPLLAATAVQAIERTPATHADRRLVPQQRPALAPGDADVVSLIGTGALGAWWSEDTTAHFGPAQRARLLDLSLLPDASGPADPVLAGFAVSRVTRLVPATHPDRRLVPAQRQAAFVSADVVLVGAGAMVAWWGVDDCAHYAWASLPGPSDPSLLAQAPVTADPTLLGWLPGWFTHSAAATHDDRRLVPQQRAYISEPSTYPTAPPTDPLTLAYGAGGTYWSSYNRAATHGDRRLYPAQRDRVSNPALLGTALLEDPLLGGGDDLARHRAWHTDRRLVPAQRTGYVPAELPADPLLVGAGVGGDAWRRVSAPATHAPRWVLRTWRQALEFMGVPVVGAITGYAVAGDGVSVYSGPGPGVQSPASTTGGG